MHSKLCVICGSKKDTLHVFPEPNKHGDRFNEWVAAIGGESLDMDKVYIYRNRRVCHKHFETKYHNRYGKLSRLAVPKLFLGDGAPPIHNLMDHDYRQVHLNPRPRGSSSDIPTSHFAEKKESSGITEEAPNIVYQLSVNVVENMDSQSLTSGITEEAPNIVSQLSENVVENTDFQSLSPGITEEAPNIVSQLSVNVVENMDSQSLTLGITEEAPNIVSQLSVNVVENIDSQSLSPGIIKEAPNIVLLRKNVVENTLHQKKQDLLLKICQIIDDVDSEQQLQVVQDGLSSIEGTLKAVKLREYKFK